MDFEPSKWLDILKASGWQTASISVACAGLVYAKSKGVLPVDFESPWPQAIMVAGAISGALAIASIGPLLVKLLRAVFYTPLHRWSYKRKVRKSVKDYIQHMTPEELSYSPWAGQFRG